MEYEYKCSVVIYGTILVTSDKLLTEEEVFERAAKQTESINPTFQVEMPDDVNTIICTKRGN